MFHMEHTPQAACGNRDDASFAASPIRPSSDARLQGSKMDLKPLFVFPRWSNTVTLLVLLFMAVFPLYAIAFIGYALDPVTLNVGYQPVQPVPYSHALHVGQLGL